MAINWNLIWPLIALQVILAVLALVSLFKADPQAIRGSKPMWVLIILFISLFGSILYFIAGRKDS
ncbi:PLDc N-terminal domain-containing protein [Paenibacillus sp. DMB20]|uniref:PLDc N-terminal domain-containing protein n=1 Tax=Paenibacillus sp. DMB20 TaxID=1642570 RepID=UPI0006281E35|nr:PLDc N-terminal domain-containing protein [Paenibacillus sp. DMB20]KKO55253.1 Negative regulatory protein YxlE [Paenibacillus sp. DMB20]